MNKFTIGEKVVCINATKEDQLKEGKLYTIKRIEGAYVVIDGFNRFFHSNRFSNISEIISSCKEEDISREHLEFVADLSKVDLETVRKVLEADLVYLDYVVKTYLHED